MSFIDNKVEQYLTQLMPIDNSLLEEIQTEGLKDEVPIIQVPSIKLIELLINIVKPTNIIEVGSAIGFSAIWIAKALSNTHIHTIERKQDMAKRARENIEKAGLKEQITLYEGDAVDILPNLPSAQFIFIDAAKGQYKNFFDLAYPLLEDGGIMVFDNILFRGYVADEETVKSKPMIRKIKEFNDYIATFNGLKTSFIPIGDGLAICYKK